jgi:TatD DNase family protein
VSAERATMTTLVDTHCHITDPRFDSDRDAVIERAHAAGVERLVAVGGGGPIELSEAAVELAAGEPSMRATAGIHPHDAKTYDDAIEQRIVALAERGAIAAVGETGLDYYYEHSPRDVQKESLARQLALAERYDLPIVLHCRDAESDLRDVLASERDGQVRGVVHCFTGAYEDARWYVDKGLLISFTGIITFKNADALRDVARRLPLDRIMVETDSPYLAPVPHRGKRNEPAFVAHVAETLAEVRNIDVETLAEATTGNALALFFDRAG